MSQDMIGYPGMGETSPHHTVYGPPQPGFSMPPSNYSQAPGAPYPPAAGYGQPSFPRAAPSYGPAPCPHVSHSQMPYPQGPYTQAPFPQMPYTQGSYTQGSYTQGPYTQGPYTQGSYAQGPYTQGSYSQGPYTEGSYTQGPYAQRSFTQRSYTQRPYPHGPYQEGSMLPSFSREPSVPPDSPGHRSDRTISRSENTQLASSSCGDKSIRQGFIRKVFMILTTQLLITVSSVATFTFLEEPKFFLYERPWIFYLACAIFGTCLIVLSCCGKVHRRHPWDLIALFFLTLSLTYVVGMIPTFYDTDIILISVSMATVVCFNVVLFTLQTKYEFTSCRGVLFVSFIVLLLFAVLCVVYQDRILEMVYASLGALLFTCYFAVDTQILLANKKLAIRPEEYVFATIRIYTDIINIFFYILTFCGRCRE